MLPVVIATLERYNLIKQTLDSLKKNSIGDVYPIVIDDGSKDQMVKKLLRELSKANEIHLVENEERSGVSYSRTIGIKLANELEQTKDSEFVYFSDNDMYFEKGWDQALLKAIDEHPEFGAVGGVRHPHHGVMSEVNWSGGTIKSSDQQPGFSMLIKKELLDSLGGFIEPDSKKGEYGREDTDLCNRYREAGYLIGAITPEVIVHCGLKHVEGTDTAGIEHLEVVRKARPDLIFE